MKSPTFSVQLISLFFFLAGLADALACGPYYPSIPKPQFFQLDGFHRPMSDYNREENLRLWQQLASQRIPLRDIEEVVYTHSLEKFLDYTDYGSSSDNKFYIYMNNVDPEVSSFLAMAKELEEERARMSSPWYYPRTRCESYETGDFSDVLIRCREYEGERLRDRYALQAVRALFASRNYAGCVEYYDSAFVNIPSGNLMKRMAQQYVAGCWCRFGEVERADTLFALVGDIWSLSCENPVAFMASVNPDAPQLIDYIRERADNAAAMTGFAPLAERLLSKRKVRNRGDWEFLLAYFYNEYAGNPSVARQYICRALRHTFSTAELADLARAYRMKLDAKTGYSGSLLADLRWIETKMDNLSPDYDKWSEIIRNIMYEDWVPHYWKKGDYATAVMLASYADNMDSDRWYSDYATLSFQMMGSVSSSQLASVYGRMMSHTPLNDFLRRKIRTDRDYYYELIGTLALREEKYDVAVNYLSQVSHKYQTSMGIYSYLRRNPFEAYSSRWSLVQYPGWEASEYETAAASHSEPLQIDAKLKFAREMLTLKRRMTGAPTADERGMARLKYAIGRHNSFEECWALTQYWRGWVGLFYPATSLYDDTESDDYAFLYDYDTTVGHDRTDEIYNKEVAAALAMMKSDKARAEAQYFLGNLKTVLKHYGDTPTANLIRTSCDNWKHWL